jgi:hypothetical protein
MLELSYKITGAAPPMLDTSYTKTGAASPCLRGATKTGPTPAKLEMSYHLTGAAPPMLEMNDKYWANAP